MRRIPRPTVTSRLSAVGIAGLVALDVALVAMAVNYTAPTPASAGGPVIASTTALSTPAPSGQSGSASSPTTSSASSTSPTSSTTPVQPAPLRMALVAVNGAVAWRTTRGSCPDGGGSVSVTSDGGKTWTPRAVGAQAVMRVRPTSTTAASVVSASRDCEPQVRTTSDSGATWTQAGGTNTTWFRDLQDNRLVHSPGLQAVRPCDEAAVLDLAPVGSSGAWALCGDGRLRASEDSGASWNTPGTVSGAVALDARADKTGSTAYVLRVADECDGLQIVRVGGGRAAASALGCVEVSAGIESGTITLSVAGSDGWVGIGERVWRSRDGMQTWSPA